MALDSLNDIIHKEEKEPKRRNTKDHMTNVQMDICTDEGSTHDSLVKRTMDTKDISSQATTPQHIQARKDIEIDQYIFELITQGLVSHQFKAYHCKVIYAIGLDRYNVLVLDVRDAVSRGKEGTGRRVENPAALLSYKAQGAMQLHFKRQWVREN